MKRNTKIILTLALILSISIAAGSIVLRNNRQKQTEFMHVSWHYNYGDLKEISQASDLIALVKVDNVQAAYERNGIPFTEYQVNVIEPIYNTEENESFTILMTGAETKDKIIVIADDPLLQPDDEFLVFCKKNSNGTYKILSGPQGRLVYEEDKLSSLNVVNSEVKEANPYSNITIDNADADELIHEIKTYTVSGKTEN